MRSEHSKFSAKKNKCGVRAVLLQACTYKHVQATYYKEPSVKCETWKLGSQFVFPGLHVLETSYQLLIRNVPNIDLTLNCSFYYIFCN